MSISMQYVTTIVRRIEDLAADVRAFELADPDERDLPPFSAGAHIDVHLPSGAIRQYSLYGDAIERNRYRLAVRREASGRGGSDAFHREVGEGATLSVSLPRNHFPLADARHHMMIAGGIGITPFLAMIGELRRTGGSFELHYCSRTPETTPFLTELAPLAADGVVHHYFSRTARRIDLAQVLAGLASDTHVYCCGPASLMDAVRSLGGTRLAGRLHFESFGAAEVVDNDSAFEVELARSGVSVTVPAGETILNALRDAGIEIASSCEAGACLECKTRFLAGTPVHRDLVMTDEDRLSFLTPCVSGCAGAKLVLDL